MLISKVLPPDQPRPNRPGVGPRDSLSVTLVIAAIATNKNVYSVLGDEILEPEIIKDRMISIQIYPTLWSANWYPNSEVWSYQINQYPRNDHPPVFFAHFSGIAANLQNSTTGRPDIARRYAKTSKKHGGIHKRAFPHMVD